MTVKARAGVPATDKQVEFVRALAEQVHGDNAPEFMLAHRESGTFDDRAETSKVIDALVLARRDAGRRQARAEGDADVPAARYALPGADGAWEFYQVDKPTKGKWSGYTFVKRLYGSPGDFAQVRISRRDARDILARISEAEYRDAERALRGPEAAAVAFSREHGVCAACLAPLTDPVSIATGLGPICRGRFVA